MQLQRQTIRVVEESHLFSGVTIHTNRLTFNPNFYQFSHRLLHTLYTESKMTQTTGFPAIRCRRQVVREQGCIAVRRMGRRTSGIAERCRRADEVVRKGRDRMCGMPFVCNVRSGMGRRSRAGTGRSSVKIRYRNVKMYISPMTENG